ncbi:hypothetical protein ACO0LD_25295 [Undibacterium sp. Ji83W]|uniref:hypothetical protein n=1 Tax=Undibacterium sp. Ji83W TaxID=3413043 RepID=UPI003BF1DEEB
MSSRHVNLDSKNSKQGDTGEAAGHSGAHVADRSAAIKSSEALLPHERDQTTDDNTKPRKVMKQALRDLQAGMQDTDLHGERGVEAVVKKNVKTESDPGI